MLYIQKQRPSSKIRSGLKRVSESTQWKIIPQDDTKGLRDCFDLLPVKPELRESLGKEQHGLCAYCMKRIDSSDSLRVKIEHFVPLSKDKSHALDYDNFLLTCDGGTKSGDLSDKNRVLCCDSSKKDTPITLNPTISHQMEHIRYNKYGKIYYSDTNYPDFADARNHEINHVLCLNGKWNDAKNCTDLDTATGIVKGRRDTYQAAITYIQRLEKKYRNLQIFRTVLEDEIQKLQNANPYPEFVGVTLFVLKRKLKQL